MRTREDLQELIDQLGITIHRLEKDFDVDAGGCVWVCYCISKNMEKRNLNYKVVVYGFPDSNPKDVWRLAQEENMCHMSILTLGQEIGGEIEPDMVKEHGLTKAVIQMTSDEILKLYEDNEFNGEYDRKNNQTVEEEIDMTFEMVW